MERNMPIGEGDYVKSILKAAMPLPHIVGIGQPLAVIIAWPAAVLIVAWNVSAFGISQVIAFSLSLRTQWLFFPHKRFSKDGHPIALALPR
jgi:hypothetical protein